MARVKVVVDEEDVGETNEKLSDLIISDLKSNLGELSYVLGRGDSPPEVVEWLSTGSTVLDMLICNNPDIPGGVPVGRLTEIYGEEATGKSFLAYMILKDCQRRGGIPILIDTENSANLTFLKMIGLDPEDGRLIYLQADSIEEVFIAIERIVTKIRESNKNKLCTIVWDSVAATSTRAELQGDVGDAQVALGPRLIGQGLRKIIRFVGRNKIALIFLNQVRMKIGVAFGNPYTTPGGKAIPFFSSVRIQLFTAGKIKNGDAIIGAGVKAKVVKNRMGPPHRETTFNIYFEHGLIDEENWIDYLLNYDVVKKISAQKSAIDFNGENIEFRNRDFIKLLSERPELKEYCKTQLKNHLKIDQTMDTESDIVVEALGEDEQL
jgi:recombination protein RecA